MFGRAIAIAFAGWLCTTEGAQALETTRGADDGLFTPVYGKTLPPIGFVEFCGRYKNECKTIGIEANRIGLTPERWSALYRVSSYINAEVEPVSDQELYAVPERWDFPSDAGDCEDYVLLKKRVLEGLGFPAEALLITVVLDELGDGHAVLTVATDEGDFILDNRRDEVLPWSQTPYRYLKRQSLDNPRQWVALSPVGRTSVADIARVNGNR